MVRSNLLPLVNKTRQVSDWDLYDDNFINDEKTAQSAEALKEVAGENLSKI